MHFNLLKYLYYFEYHIEKKRLYFDMTWYNICEESLKQWAIGSFEKHGEEMFLPLPQISLEEIFERYQTQMQRKFECLEECLFTKEFRAFRAAEVTIFATAWLREHHIDYATQPVPVKVENVTLAFLYTPVDFPNMYLNTINNEIYDERIKELFINEGKYGEQDFLPLSYLDESLIIKKYLSQKAIPEDIVVNYFGEAEKEDLSRNIHCFAEDNDLVDDWNDFRNAELAAFAVKWFEEHHIDYILD